MTNRLLAPYPWKEITHRIQQANKEGRRCQVAVAYCATGARKLMPLARGSLLVVNASERVVKSGLTNPSELMKFIRAGVQVHNVDNLHAKVFTLGRYAIVGSTNASSNSAKDLIEAALISSDRAVVQQCRKFVEDLCAEKIELDRAKQLAKIYRPPRSPGKRTPKKPSKAVPRHSPLWLVPLTHEPWDEEDDAQDKKARPTAEKKIDPKLERLDAFAWTGADLYRRLEKGHMTIQVIKAGRIAMLSPPAHVIHIRRWRSAKRNAHRMIVYLAKPRGKQRRRRPDVVAKLGARSKPLRKLKRPRLVRDAVAARALLRVWNHPGGKR